MKILIISSVSELAHVRKIPAALAKHKDTQITVITANKMAAEKIYAPSGWITYDGEETFDNVRFIPLPMVDPTNRELGFNLAELTRLIAQVKPDIIQVWSGPTSPFLSQVAWARTRAFSRAKVIFYGYDNLPIPLSRCSVPKWRLKWMQIAAGIEADSEAVRNVCAAGFRKPVERIFWGIPLEYFQQVDKAAVRAELNLPYEHIVGYIGRLIPEKGLMFLLGALRHIPNSVHCLMIGSGPMQGELELWIKLLGLQDRVHIFGAMPADAVGRYMSSLDALALPSMTTPLWKEQYGRVLGEAMACGVPVIGSDSGAIPEVIGDAGIVVKEADTLALADGINLAIFDEDLRNRIIPLGLRRVQEEMSTEAMSRNLLTYYRKILGAR